MMKNEIRECNYCAAITPNIDYCDHCKYFVYTQFKELEKEIEGLRVKMPVETPSQPRCLQCGFPNDRTECMCNHNRAISLVLQIIKAKRNA
jgi:hypothetical protein